MTDTAIVKCRSRKTSNRLGFQGVIIVRVSGQTWRYYTPITRLTREDAIIDAKNFAENDLTGPREYK